MKRVCATAIMSVVGIFSIQAVSGAPDTKQFVGRWNIQIQGTGDTFRTAWLKLTETDGELGGWREFLRSEDVGQDGKKIDNTEATKKRPDRPAHALDPEG